MTSFKESTNFEKFQKIKRNNKVPFKKTLQKSKLKYINMIFISNNTCFE